MNLKKKSGIIIIIIIIIINNLIGMTCTGIAKVLSKSAIKSTVYLIEQEQML